MDRRELLLDELSTLAARIELAEARVGALYDQRLTLFRQAKDCTPPVLNSVLAERAGVSASRVSQKLGQTG